MTAQDHRDKLIDKLLKLQRARDGEATLGNTAAAEAFANAINRMLIDNELSESDLDYARAADVDPVIEVHVNFGVYGIKVSKKRTAWQESLAGVVASANLCQCKVYSRSNQITFIGTKSHAMVAEYTYGVLVPAAAEMAHVAYWDYVRQLRQEKRDPKLANGFYASWLTGFVYRISERFREARTAAVAASTGNTGLMRLNQALVKVKAYVEDKYKDANNLKRRDVVNTIGYKHGRAAADNMNIGLKGVNTTQSNRGMINS